MSGIAMMMMAAGGFKVNNAITMNESSRTTGTDAITIQADGSTTASFLAQPNWGSPTTANAGDNYWVLFTSTGGTATIFGTVGTWLQLTVGRSIGVNGVPNGQSRFRTFTYQIAVDAVGSSIVGGGNMTITVDNT